MCAVCRSCFRFWQITVNKMEFFVFDYLAGCACDSDAVRACLAAASGFAEKRIVFDRKDWSLCEAVLLENHTHIIIDGCTVQLADFTYDNVFRGKNVIVDENEPYGTPKACLAAEDIKIEGRRGAVISGPVKKKRGYHAVLEEEQDMVGDFWGWRTFLISLSNCSGLEICGLTFKNACGWAMSFDMCRGGHIHDIVFDTHVKNGDGVDMRSGCHNFTVERVCGTTSDDTVACTALYSEGQKYPLKNYLYTLEPSICIQNREAYDRDISDIMVKNIKTGGMHHAVICLAANGNRVYNIHIENIEEPNADLYREATVKLYTGYGSGYSKGDIHSINVKNIFGRYAKNTVYCNAEVENVRLENIRHTRTGHEIKLDYPEGVEVK